MTVDVDTLPDAVLVLDDGGRVQAANAAARRLLKVGDDVVGAVATEALALRDGLGRPAADAGFPKVGKEQELTARGGDGEDVGLVVTAAHSGDGVVLCARPVSDKSGIAIVSTVSHELRSPLTSVKGYVSLMLNRWERIDDVRKREMLTQVHADADRVTRLVTELLDISRLETGRLVLRREFLSLGTLAATVVEKVAMAYPQLDCTVEVDGLPDVWADPDKLEQVFTNLVENAAKYGNPVGMRVTGEVRDVDGSPFVVVAVTDRGEGIPEGDLPKVFTKFFRRDHGKPTGTGLGLWISRGLVEAHGGTLTASSVVGEGSTFTFTVPADAFETAHPER